ncbi:MAG TPA: aminotransferase class I/II-fold pyridoxal phosphate-dependent enzyme, partial [Acidimicrobiales bacterium]
DSVAIRAGRRDNGTALAPILWASSVFVTPSLDEARRMSTVPRAERFYSRYSNPSVKAFEDAVAELEGAQAALAFASGMGALATVVMALCSPGDHIVAQRHIYSGTQLYLQGVCGRFGIDVTFVDGTEPGAFAAAVRPGRTVLVIAETPANPVLAITDLDELGAIQGPFKLVDSTFATPVLQQPLGHGVDLVLHSATKGIGGHNDATIGVVAGSTDLIDAVWGYSVLHGACASPFDAMNGLRGIRTLAVRVERQCHTALALARWLEQHPAVSSVRYPFLDSHPQRDLAARQMSGGGTMVTFDLAGGLEAGRHFCEGVRLAQMASSLGGPETLVTSPANSTHVGLSPAERAAGGITDGLIRMSVGLEHVDDLRADLARALG